MAGLEWTISLADIVQILLLLIGLIKYVSKIDSHEQWIQGHIECTREHVKVSNKVNKTLAYLRGKLHVPDDDDEEG